jgi:hypothetical protein
MFLHVLTPSLSAGIIAPLDGRTMRRIKWLREAAGRT